jgi:PPOX class probable F420-dependent enzyme
MGARALVSWAFVTTPTIPDASTPFGERVRRRLNDDVVAWLTTVGRDGTPQPNPVWFLWDGDTILVYNRPDANRLAHVRERPRVALHLDSNGGGNVVVVTGSAELAEGEPAPHERPEYVAKYGQRMAAISGSLEAFSRAYPVALRIGQLSVRGF